MGQWAISNAAGRVKGVLILFFFVRAPVRLCAVTPFARPDDSPVIVDQLQPTRSPLSFHQLGVAQQTSLRSLWTVMIYSNSPALKGGG